MLEELSLNFVFQFMLVFARLGTAFSKFPAIGSHYIFARGKLSLALTVSLFIFLQPTTRYRQHTTYSPHTPAPTDSPLSTARNSA